MPTAFSARHSSSTETESQTLSVYCGFLSSQRTRWQSAWLGNLVTCLASVHGGIPVFEVRRDVWVLELALSHIKTIYPFTKKSTTLTSWKPSCVLEVLLCRPPTDTWVGALDGKNHAALDCSMGLFVLCVFNPGYVKSFPR